MKRARKKNINKPTSPEITTQPKKRRTRSVGTVFKIIGIVLAVLLTGIFVVLGFDLIDESKLLMPVGETGKINVLLLGVDKDGLRTDSIMVASYDLESSDLNLISVPRDTKVYVKNREVTRKMTEVHAMSKKDGNGELVGAIGTTEAVTQLTGIPINYYIEFSFDTAAKLIDTLGPITYNVPDVEGNGRGMNYDDDSQDLHIHLKPGEQELGGKEIVGLMRYRKGNNGGGDGDYGRMQRQQNVIKAIVDQKLNISLIFKIPQIFAEMQKEITTNLSAADVAKYAQYLGDFSTEKIKTYQLPGTDGMINRVSYFLWDIKEAKTMISNAFGYDTTNITDKIEVTGNIENARELAEKCKSIETPEPTMKSENSDT